MIPVATTPGPWTFARNRIGGHLVAALLLVVALTSHAVSRADPGWLGVAVSTAPAEFGPAARLGVIAHDSPAERAGLREGDLVRRAGTWRIRRAADLIRAVQRSAPGATLSLALERDGTGSTIDVVLAERPAGFARLFEYERDAWQEPDRVLDALDVRSAGAVVDLGAGGGYFSERLAERVGREGHVVAVDIDADALAALARRFPRADFPQVLVQAGTATDPGLAAASADAVLIVDAYHEFPDPGAMLGAIGRALRPSGRLVIVDRPAAEWHPEAHAIPEERVREQVAAAGFRELDGFALPRQFVLVFTPQR